MRKLLFATLLSAGCLGMSSTAMAYPPAGIHIFNGPLFVNLVQFYYELPFTPPPVVYHNGVCIAGC